MDCELWHVVILAVSANNPFSAPQSTNPFDQMRPQPATINQLQASSYMSGFTQPAAATLLPAPMLPVATTGQVPAQQQGYNPFLWGEMIRRYKELGGGGVKK